MSFKQDLPSGAVRPDTHTHLKNKERRYSHKPLPQLFAVHCKQSIALAGNEGFDDVYKGTPDQIEVSLQNRLFRLAKRLVTDTGKNQTISQL